MTDRGTGHWHGRHYDAVHIAGPVHFLNPTTRFLAVHQKKPSQKHHQQLDSQVQNKKEHAEHNVPTPDELDGDKQKRQQQQQQHTAGVYNVWRSRDNRKGRHALALTPSVAAGGDDAQASSTIDGITQTPKPTNTVFAVLAGLARMVTRYPVWDISYDVAVIFTLGSIVWVLNGFFVLLPTTSPTTSWSGESSWGGGISACVGATIFEVGSILLMLEAVNENRADCFGWALEEAVLGQHVEEEEEGHSHLRLRRETSNECRHHHSDKKAWLKSSAYSPSGTRKSSTTTMTSSEKPNSSTATGNDGNGNMNNSSRKWTWFPTWYELRSHYFRDIGFLACFSQMIGATVFWISGFTGLPQILDGLTVPAENGVYWLPQVIGGTGFIISSFFFMLETQSKWYLPAPRQLGWHIGFWNLVGALGFTLCGALGFASDSNTACEIGLVWATFVGSWAFLIGSIIQWYESLDKYPCIVDKNLSPKKQIQNPLEDSVKGNIDQKVSRISPS